MNYETRQKLSSCFLDEVYETLNRKGNDYASDKDAFSNFTNTAMVVGVPVEKVFLSEITKKVSRIIELLDKPANCEPVYDSIRDIAGYACLLENYMRGLELEKQKINRSVILDQLIKAGELNGKERHQETGCTLGETCQRESGRGL